MRRVVPFLALVTGLCAVTLPAAAQGGGMRQGMRAPDHWLTFDSLTEAVGLTAQQKAEAQQHFDAIQNTFKQAVEHRQKMRQMFQSGERPTQEQFQQMRAEMDSLQTVADTHYNELRAMLTADQQAAFDKLPKPHVAMRRGGMRGGGMRGRGGGQ
ncbi:MAG TPA: Spy/CpxP family protein refolding chaperone [Gemmatimonadales bacterium]|nr:Spy/CpxP family protein refolding chaperone [Gemmatimonadales bacterium]